MNRQGTQYGMALWIWPLVLIGGGVLLLLQNYLLLDFDVLQFWPVLLVALGLQIALSGDLSLSKASQNFGITRGSVESATLRANSGALDLRIQALQREGRLIAGQYTARSRPQLQAEGSHAILSMQRSKTWLLSLADWDFSLAKDLPWHLELSAYLGEIQVDMRGLVIGSARISSGIGDIHVIGPDTPAGPITLRSGLGHIHLTLSDRLPAAVTVQAGSLFDVHLESDRWLPDGERRYVTPDYAGAVDPLEFTIRGATGGLYLA